MCFLCPFILGHQIFKVFPMVLLTLAKIIYLSFGIKYSGR